MKRRHSRGNSKQCDLCSENYAFVEEIKRARMERLLVQAVIINAPQPGAQMLLATAPDSNDMEMLLPSVPVLDSPPTIPESSSKSHEQSTLAPDSTTSNILVEERENVQLDAEMLAVRAPDSSPMIPDSPTSPEPEDGSTPAPTLKNSSNCTASECFVEEYKKMRFHAIQLIT